MKKIIFVFFACFVCAIGVYAQAKLKVRTIGTEFETTYGSCSISIDYPESGNAVFNKAVNSRFLALLKKLGDNSEDLERKAQKVKDATTMDYFIKEVAEKVGRKVSDEWAEAMAEGSVDSLMCSHDLLIKLIVDKPLYLCFSVIDYGYFGGVHGFTSYLPLIVRKSDGKIISNVFRKDKVGQLYNYLKKNFYKNDFGGLQMADIDKNDWKAKAEFAEALRDYGSFSEPDLAWIDGKNVYIQYQQYEIVPYAYGAPVVELPLRIAMPYLTNEVKALLNGSKKAVKWRSSKGLRKGAKRRRR